MRRYKSMIALFAIFLTAIPVVPAILSHKAGDVHISELLSGDNDDNEADNSKDDIPDGKSFSVLDVSTGTVLELSLRDYVIGCVCAEMPATFESEAIKAQAVAAHTYAVRQQQLEAEHPTPELCGADFSNDSEHYQAYFTESQIKQYYGEQFDIYYEKISSAVDEVLPYILKYKDEPIIAAFCSMSSGRTESAENVWGTAVDYLISVDSAADVSAPQFLDEVEISQKDLKEKLSSAFPDVDFNNKPLKKWVEIKSTSEAGTVLKADICGYAVTGQEIRSALGLRSAAFTVEFNDKDKNIKFTTKGYGHGVGMSQYGANSMAKNGADWKDILQYYYPETTCVKEE